MTRTVAVSCTAECWLRCASGSCTHTGSGHKAVKTWQLARCCHHACLPVWPCTAAMAKTSGLLSALWISEMIHKVCKSVSCLAKTCGFFRRICVGARRGGQPGLVAPTAFLLNLKRWCHVLFPCKIPTIFLSRLRRLHISLNLVYNAEKLQ